MQFSYSSNKTATASNATALASTSFSMQKWVYKWVSCCLLVVSLLPLGVLTTEKAVVIPLEGNGLGINWYPNLIGEDYILKELLRAAKVKVSMRVLKFLSLQSLFSLEFCQPNMQSV